jgi:hypothetical protein
MSLSIGIFFSLMVAGLASTLPRTLTAGLHGQGVPLAIASKVAHLPPVSTLFAALLGYNPIHNLLGPTGVLNKLSPAQVNVLTGKKFFPTVISGPFHHGLVIVFTAAAIMSFIGAMVSLLRGKQFYWEEPAAGNGAAQAVPAAAPGRASSSAATSSAATAANGHAPAANGNGAYGNGAVPNGPHAGANGPGEAANGTAHGPGEAGARRCHPPMVGADSLGWRYAAL